MILRLWQKLSDALKASIVARGAATTFVVRVYGAVLAYAIQIYLARSIGAEELGVYVFCWTWLSIVAFLTPLGFDTSLVKFLASYEATSDFGRLRGSLHVGYRSTLWTSMAAALTGVGIVVFLDPGLSGAYSKPMLIALMAVPIVAMTNLLQGIARGFKWVAYVAAPSFAIRPTVFLALSVLVVVAFGLRDGRSILVAAVAAACVTLAIQYWIFRRAVAPAVRTAHPSYESKEWVRISVPMMLVASFELMLANTDILMMGLIHGPAETGVYNVAVRTSSALLFVFFAVTSFAAPKIAELHARGDRTALIAFSGRTRIWMFGPTLGLALLLVACAPFLLSLFGSEFGSALAPMMVLTAGVLLRAAAGPVDNLLNMTGKERQLALALCAATLMNLVANALLIPKFGGLGASIGTTCSIVVELVIVSYVAGRHIGFTPFLFRRASGEGRP